jgi:hypothetical protein
MTRWCESGTAELALGWTDEASVPTWSVEVHAVRGRWAALTALRTGPRHPGHSAAGFPVWRQDGIPLDGTESGLNGIHRLVVRTVFFLLLRGAGLARCSAGEQMPGFLVGRVLGTGQIRRQSQIGL